MNKAEALKALERAGSEQTRKTYARHGVKGPMFGVSYAELGKLAKQIKTDQRLAEQLWTSKNHDARVLATMIADPASSRAPLLKDWLKDVDNNVLVDALSKVAGKSPDAGKLAAQWIKTKAEWPSAAGWAVLSVQLCEEQDLPEDELVERIAQIEREIHKAPNRTRHTMNMALINIGTRGGKLQELAIAAAGRIGKVEIDHGETECKTPDAIEYIRKVMAYRENREQPGRKRAGC
ncbi:MAG: DNA alkylation repair protein [Planctomycetes bacterium]|nr:DNA alkylation repair protein [Planctomycetota bacterium]